MGRLWNNLKTTLLMGSLMGLCMGIGYLVGGRMGITYAFVLGGHYETVGFFLVAKAVANFRHIEDRPSLEYVLIGTLMSTGLAIAVGELVNHLIAG